MILKNKKRINFISFFDKYIPKKKKKRSMGVYVNIHWLVPIYIYVYVYIYNVLELNREGKLYNN